MPQGRHTAAGRSITVGVTMLAIAAGLAVLAAPGHPGPATAQAQEAPPACPDAVPLDEVTQGDTGTGYTVVSGTQPTSFDAEVVRVVEDWVGPDQDVIIVELSGEAFDQAGVDEAWFGMSGSPVYTDDGRLLGAVAWGIAGGGSVVGLTPGEDVRDLAGKDPAQAATATAQSANAERLSADDRQAVAEATGTDPAQLDAEPLPSPLFVDGIGAEHRKALRHRIDHHGLPFAVGRAPATSPDTTITDDAVDAVRPGGNFADRRAHGDVSVYGVNTTTVVCDDRAVGVGHPVSFAGEDDVGASLADTIAITDGLPGPMKMASLADPVGRVDQDRSAGLRALLGEQPFETVITSEALDETSGRSRQGETRVAEESFLPMAAGGHVAVNVEAVQNRVGEGTALTSYTVTGHTAKGEEFRIDRENRHASQSSVSQAAGAELSHVLARLQNNEFADATVEQIDLQVKADTEYRDLRLAEVSVTVGDETHDLKPPVREPLEVDPGDTLEVTAALRPWQQQDTREEVTMTLEVPDDYEGPAMLRVGAEGTPELPPEHHADLALGGLPGPGIPPPPPPPHGDAESFEDLVAELEDRPRNDELVAELHPEVGPHGPAPHPGELEEGPPPPDDPRLEEGASPPPPLPPGEREPLAEARTILDDVVRGSRVHPLAVGGFGPVDVDRAAGPDRAATAAELSRESHPDPNAVDTAVVARGDDPADALAGGPLAAHHDAPLLLTGTDSLPEATAEELARLEPDTVLVLGGPQAVSDAVADQLADLGGRIERIVGENRYGTAAQIAERLPGRTGYVALGDHPDPSRAWPDALGAGRAAAVNSDPVLLAAPSGLPGPTRAALDQVDDAVIVGGQAAVPAEVERQLADRLLGVRRLAGSDRYETSVRLARHVMEQGVQPTSAWLATGRDFPDAMAAAPAAASEGGPLLLLDGRHLAGSPASAEFLHGLAPNLERLVLAGGEDAISPGVEAELHELSVPPPAPDGPAPPPPPPPEGPAPEGELG